MRSCVFCKMLADEMPASFVYRDVRVSAFLDIQPVNPGHLLVVPNEHVAELGELPVATANAMMEIAQRLAQALRSTQLLCEGVNLFLADGKVAGQEVAHVHLHVIPRSAGDGFGLRFGPEYETLPKRGDLDHIALAIREAMARAQDI
ncbi:HIT family protein [Candidatus Bipolaricaulota bacterium]|nr:HIT family protein [Candidatus Bipolaricaulota bacterium]TFH09262.1 MAG: HIT family protein [Candidatus Atribacteria bacterium]